MTFEKMRGVGPRPKLKMLSQDGKMQVTLLILPNWNVKLGLGEVQRCQKVFHAYYLNDRLQRLHADEGNSQADIKLPSNRE